MPQLHIRPRTILYLHHFHSNFACCVVLCCVMLCYAMLCGVMLCYAMLCYAMLCYVFVLSNILHFLCLKIIELNNELLGFLPPR